jgi:signal transduction histidine kinase
VAADPSNGLRSAGSTAPRRRSLRGIGPAPLTPPRPVLEFDVPAEDSSDSQAAVHRALAHLRTDLGYETISLFVQSENGWELLDRDGRIQPWHPLLDPTTLEDVSDAAEYPDVRTIPGVGERLAKLGCASLAALPLPDGARILLDSATPCAGGGWIERARPYLALISIMSGPGWPAGGALQAHHEAAAMHRVFSACQSLLERPGATMDSLLAGIRDALRADELFLIADMGAELEVLADPTDNWPRRLPAELRAALVPDGSAALEPRMIHRLAVALGVASSAMAGAFGRDDHDRELLVAGWKDGVALSPLSMAVVARAVSTTRVALQGRRQAISALMQEERNRMAYALHDDLTQTVTSAVLELEALRSRIQHDPSEAMSVLDASKSEIRRALSDLRALLFDLHKSHEEERYLEPLTTYVQDVLKRWRLPARVQVEGDLSRVPARVLSVAYVVIREALANAAKHASSTNVAVKLAAQDAELEVIVADTGRGFTMGDEHAARRAHHFGLNMLRQRVVEVGGALDIESIPDKGTRIVARLPMQEVAS